MRLGVLFLFFSLLPLAAQNAQLAGMQQDLAELRTEVEKLKLENADLRAALNRQKTGQSPAASQNETFAKARAETLTEVDRKLKQQTADVNAALGKSAPAPASNAGKASADAGAPSGIPQTGIKYHVKSGDTVTKIALRNGSKVEWIMKANNLSSPNELKADVDIFIPQAETPAR